MSEIQAERDLGVSGRIILKRAPNTTYTAQTFYSPTNAHVEFIKTN